MTLISYNFHPSYIIHIIQSNFHHSRTIHIIQSQNIQEHFQHKKTTLNYQIIKI